MSGSFDTRKLELLMPAGSPTKMKLALAYGADAVYLGPPLYSLRARDNDFDLETMREAIQFTHSQNKKVYMTLNIFARNRKLGTLKKEVLNYAAMKPDAFIMSDPGMISMARELAPEIPVHLSVQANCMNWQSVKFWKNSLQVERVILSRELSIVEIAEIKQRVPDVELEAFVHGSICIAYSGRCLLSSYMGRRDANQGVCDNSCREKYKVIEKEYYIRDSAEEDSNLNYQIDEDEEGTYILNAKDLCMIAHLKELADAGVVSFKVEGRTKSEFYAAMVARAYRGALNDLGAGKPFNTYWQEELNKLTHRGYHTAFMFEQPGPQGQSYLSSTQYNKQFKCVGFVKKSNVQDHVIVNVKNKLHQGQKLNLITPDGGSHEVVISKIINNMGVEKSEVHSGSGDFKVYGSGFAVNSHDALLVSDEA
jgi:putative protease